MMTNRAICIRFKTLGANILFSSDRIRGHEYEKVSYMNIYMFVNIFAHFGV